MGGLELDGLTKAFGWSHGSRSWSIAVFGLARGQDGETLALVCVSTAISAVPTGLSTGEHHASQRQYHEAVRRAWVSELASRMVAQPGVPQPALRDV